MFTAKKMFQKKFQQHFWFLVLEIKNVSAKNVACARKLANIHGNDVLAAMFARLRGHISDQVMPFCQLHTFTISTSHRKKDVSV